MTTNIDREKALTEEYANKIQQMLGDAALAQDSGRIAAVTCALCECLGMMIAVKPQTEEVCFAAIREIARLAREHIASTSPEQKAKAATDYALSRAMAGLVGKAGDA